MEVTFDIKPSCKAEEYLFKLNKEANKKNTPNCIVPTYSFDTKIAKIDFNFYKELLRLDRKNC